MLPRVMTFNPLMLHSNSITTFNSS